MKEFLIIETYHERYSFEQAVKLCSYKSLTDLCKNEFYEYSDFKEFRSGYLADYSAKRNINKYELIETEIGETLEKEIEEVQIEAIYIIELEKLRTDEDGFAHFCFCDTNKKFGLLDFKDKGEI